MVSSASACHSQNLAQLDEQLTQSDKSLFVAVRKLAVALRCRSALNLQKGNTKT
jgi:hypothetical protein